MRKYKAVIFDLDGTLLNPEEGLISAVKSTIEKANLPKLSNSDMKKFIGPPIQISFKNYYGLDDVKAQEVADIFRKRYKEQDLLKAKVYDEVFILLKSLKEKGYKLGIATYKRQDYTNILLKELLLDKYFNIIVGGDNENKLSKTDIINKCINELKYQPENIIMVGDTVYDLNAAQNLNMDFIAVTYGFGFKSEKECNTLNIKMVADSPLKIVDWF